MRKQITAQLSEELRNDESVYVRVCTCVCVRPLRWKLLPLLLVALSCTCKAESTQQACDHVRVHAHTRVRTSR